MKTPNRKILMLLDNVTVHPKYYELENVELLFLPSNTTSMMQPFDQGVIKDFKNMYRRNILSVTFRKMKEDSDIL